MGALGKKNYCNPRSLAGATKIFEPWHSVIAFQSTLPCGSDLLGSLTFSSTWGFNPRSLAGATVTCCSQRQRLLFQSTLPHGSDFTHGQELQALLVFQSTLPHGSDFIPLMLDFSMVLFQSTLPHGSDTYFFQSAAGRHYFNPRSLTGATRY